MAPKIGIIVINYKEYASRFLEDCVASLLRMDYPRDCFRIYVVDNVTTPESQALIASISDQVVVVPSPGNGWGHGNNVGAAQAKKDGFADYLGFWNMDIEVEPTCLTELVSAMEADNTIAIAQPKVMLYPQNDEEKKQPLINSSGNAIHFLGFGFMNGYREPADSIDDAIVDIPSASGCGMLIRGSVFEEIGRCDENLFMYHDDLELCYKARLFGYRVVIVPKSILWHKYEFGRSISKIYYMERNRLLFLLQFYHILTLILIFPAWLFMEMGQLVFAIKNRWLGAKLKTYIYFFRPSTWQEISKMRRTILKKRKISEKMIAKSFTGQIMYQEIDNPLLRYVANPIFSFYWKLAYRVIFW